MGLIDSHAHLTADVFDVSSDDLLDRACEAGVDHVISVGTDVSDARRVIDLATESSRVSAAVGIHPHEAGKVAGDDWSRLPELLADPVVVAAGEMGLDYHYDFADRGAQFAAFEEQLALASPTSLPIIIHCREAHSDTLAILETAGYRNRKVVFHCFTGTAREAAEIRDRGWRLSFTGVITFKNAKEVGDIATQYPIDSLMLETDAPYLSPQPVRHVRPNEPAHLVHTARWLAERRGISYDELVEHTVANTRSFFNLSL